MQVPKAKAGKIAGASAPAITQGLKPPDAADLARSQLLREFSTWCQFSGLRVDEHDFSFNDRRYLIDIYNDRAEHVVVKKAAQLGLSVYLQTRALWAARVHQMKVGFYLPTDELARQFSKDRIDPMVRSHPDLLAGIIEDEDAAKLKRFKNHAGGESSLYIMHIGGRSSKDALPLDYLVFDELRLMQDDDVQQTMHRIAASKWAWVTMASTAGPAGVTIDKYFQIGTQHTWLSKCGCQDGGVDLAETFPSCVVEHKGETYYRCPKCLYRINDPQNGGYVAKHPNADVHSYFVSQLASKQKQSTPRKIMESYKLATNLQKFYADVLGRWYLNADARPITPEVLENCINPESRWAYDQRFGGEQRPQSELMEATAMGVDQHGGNVYVVIQRRDEDGNKHLLHLEVVETGNGKYNRDGRPQSPFVRLRELMKEFDVGCCVIDAMPNYNEAADFARSFPGRVFVSYYAAGSGDAVRWMDRSGARDNSKKGAALVLKWQVYLNRYKAIDDALSEFVNRKIFIPPPNALLMEAYDGTTGRYDPQPIAQRYFRHLQSIAREREVTNPDTGEFKMEWRNQGLDPHFVHATSFCRVAMERMTRRPVFTIL